MDEMNNLDELFRKYIHGNLSAAEVKLLANQLDDPELAHELERLLLEGYDANLGESAWGAEDREKFVRKLMAKIEVETGQAVDANMKVAAGRQPTVVVSLNWKKWAMAAALITIIATTFFTYNSKYFRNDEVAIVSNLEKEEILPGKNGAILTLADGVSIVLDSLSNRNIAVQKGTRIMMEDGKLVYRQSGTTDTAVLYNTVTTPNGRQLQLTLPDGSRVWLNAHSSITYPTSFVQEQRDVRITGEVYFEVAPYLDKMGKKLPFIVAVTADEDKATERSRIEVLGTHFNVNAYEDEKLIRTTLLEGSVNVMANGKKAHLKPGEQAQVSLSGSLSVEKSLNLANAIAWKNGYFDFHDKKIDEVMRELSRWYDINVVYERNIPSIEFVGKIDRSLTLAQLLIILEKSKVNFRIEEGRRLVVSG